MSGHRLVYSKKGVTNIVVWGIVFIALLLLLLYHSQIANKTCEITKEQLNKNYDICKNESDNLKIKAEEYRSNLSKCENERAYCEGAKEELKKRQVLGGFNIALNTLLLVVSLFLGKAFEKENKHRWWLFSLGLLILAITIYLSYRLGW